MIFQFNRYVYICIVKMHLYASTRQPPHSFPNLICTPHPPPPTQWWYQQYKQINCGYANVKSVVHKCSSLSHILMSIEVASWYTNTKSCSTNVLLLHISTRLSGRYHFNPAWTSNHRPNKLWDEITYPFPNLNGATVVHVIIKGW